MIIKAPALNREETATNENIAEIVRRLKGKEQPFAILLKDATSFIQTLWTPEGYILAYQENDLEHIYRARELVSQADVIWAFQSYLKGDVFWKGQFEFEQKTADNLIYLAYKIGTIAGKIVKFIRGK
jgi:hypothetical protein